MRRLRVLGVNSGNGICLYPFKLNPNFHLIGGIEPRGVFHTKKQEQWRLNFGNLPLWKAIPDDKLEVDIIIGHPDCGDSSILRMSRAKKSGNPKINASINLFFRSINHYRPSYFLLENLPGLLDAYPIDNISEILLGKYELSFVVCPVSLFGNSQMSRKRLVIVGRLILGNSSSKDHNPFGPLQLTPHKIRASESFELGPENILHLGHVREPLEKMTNLYVEKGVRRITYLEAFERWNALGDQAQRWPVGGVMKNQPGVTRNIRGKPPLTVRKQNRQFGTEGYVLSPREMANIQGVPSCFKIFINPNQIVYWINKARVTVTKCMPYEIAVWFMRYLLLTLNKKYHGNSKSKFG